MLQPTESSTGLNKKRVTTAKLYCLGGAKISHSMIAGNIGRHRAPPDSFPENIAVVFVTTVDCHNHSTVPLPAVFTSS
jgi:hypothetical protein